jgi:hypothetical protein
MISVHTTMLIEKVLVEMGATAKNVGEEKFRFLFVKSMQASKKMSDKKLIKFIQDLAN